MSASGSRNCQLPKLFPVEWKFRENQSANTRVVAENLTMKLYPWVEEMVQCPVKVSEFKVHLRSFNVLHDYNFYWSLSIHTIFEVPDIIPGYRSVLIIV